MTITIDRLRLEVIKAYDSIDRSRAWMAYLGLAGTLWGSLVVGDFDFPDKRFGFTGVQWGAIYLAFAALATVQASRRIKAAIQRPSVESILRSIVAAGHIAVEDRILFLAEATDRDGALRLLVYRDALWDCYMLPHSPVHEHNIPGDDDPILVGEIARFVGLEEQHVHIQRIEHAQLENQKYSDYHGALTDYRFTFFRLSIADAQAVPDRVWALEFVWHDNRFRWMTTSELEADPNTFSKNVDVTRYIRDRLQSNRDVRRERLPIVE